MHISNASSLLSVHPSYRQEAAIPAPQPTRWKMTLVLWVMVYPMITGLGLVLNPFLKDRPLLVRNLVLTAIFTPAMVYGVSPVARKLVLKLEAQPKK